MKQPLHFEIRTNPFNPNRLLKILLVLLTASLSSLISRALPPESICPIDRPSSPPGKPTIRDSLTLLPLRSPPVVLLPATYWLWQRLTKLGVRVYYPWDSSFFLRKLPRRFFVSSVYCSQFYPPTERKSRHLSFLHSTQSTN